MGFFDDSLAVQHCHFGGTLSNFYYLGGGFSHQHGNQFIPANVLGGCYAGQSHAEKFRNLSRTGRGNLEHVVESSEEGVI